MRLKAGIKSGDRACSGKQTGSGHSSREGKVLWFEPPQSRGGTVPSMAVWGDGGRSLGQVRISPPKRLRSLLWDPASHKRVVINAGALGDVVVPAHTLPLPLATM